MCLCSGGGGEKGGGGKGTEAGKKEGGDGASNSSSDSTLAASMNEDNHRLQCENYSFEHPVQPHLTVSRPSLFSQYYTVLTTYYTLATVLKMSTVQLLNGVHRFPVSPIKRLSTVER